MSTKYQFVPLVQLPFIAGFVENLLSLKECQDIINKCEKTGFQLLSTYDPNYRNYTRTIFTDHQLARFCSKD